MPTQRWKKLSEVKNDAECLALISYLPLNRYRMMTKFLKYSGQVQNQLKTTDGIIGYSLRAKVFGKKFWTLSVWKGEEALMKFVRTMPHLQVMRNLAGHMGQTRFERWKINGADVPPKWSDALKKLEVHKVS